MDGIAHLLPESGGDEPLPLDTRTAGKPPGNDRDAKMRLSFGAMSGVALVEMRLIHNLQPVGRKSILKLAPYYIRDRHE